jgi:hypothetical protein
MAFQDREKRIVHTVLFVAAVTLCGEGYFAKAAGTFVESEVTLLHTFSSVGGNFGWAVAELTDISNPPDGVTDIIIPSLGEARVFVYSGATAALLHTLVRPVEDSGSFGNAVGDAGDVNGDGVNDIVVGSPGGSFSGTNPGHAYVYSGADGSLLLTLTGEAIRDSFGSGVGGAGDVNNDGRGDILVGASTNDASGADSGRAYIFSGMDGSLIRPLNAEAAGDGFGAGTAGTGDVNGDNIGDQIVGAPGAGISGRAYVFSGADGSLLFATNADAGGGQYGVFFVAGVGDVNNDGRRDVYVGDYASNGGRGKAYVYSGLNGSLIHSILGPLGAGLGCGRGAGDVNGDGHADLLIGHYTNSSGAANAGRAVLYSGATGAVLRTITSTTGGENLGFDAVGVGDTNGDGLTDLLVSASSQSRVYLIAGIQHVVPTNPPLADPSGLDKSRFISFAPGNGTAPTAIRVLLNSLHHVSPPYSTGPSTPFTSFEGQERWVGPPSQFAESSATATPFFASVLQCAPHYRDWSTIPLLHVTGSGIVPSSTYQVENVAAACAGVEATAPCTAGGIRVSSRLEARTTRWGDVETPYNPPSTTAQPDVSDIAAMVAKFRSAAGAPTKARVLIAAMDGVGNIEMSSDLSFSHIAACVDAFRGGGYPYTIASCP